MARSGGQFHFKAGEAASARNFKRANFENSGGAAGVDSNSPRFLRELERGMRGVPVSRTGSCCNKPYEVGGESCRAMTSSLAKALFPNAAGDCLAATELSDFGFFIGTVAESS